MEQSQLMDSGRRPVEVSQLVSGLVLILIGGLFLADRFDLFELRGIVEYWPMILVVVGLGKLFGTREQIGSGAWLIGIGLWLQVSTLGLWGFDFSNSWPLLIVAAGISTIAKGLFGDSSCARKGGAS